MAVNLTPKQFIVKTLTPGAINDNLGFETFWRNATGNEYVDRLCKISQGFAGHALAILRTVTVEEMIAS